jgi:hypothetical protein
LAATTFVPPLYAATGIALGWVAITLPVFIGQSPLQVLDQRVLLIYAGIALLSTLVFALRSRHLATDWSIG